jgi:hypothetical protein
MASVGLNVDNSVDQPILKEAAITLQISIVWKLLSSPVAD